MVMINMCYESENQRIPPIPSWPGFNILLLQKHIPTRGNICYLPVVNGNSTRLNTVIAIFLKSLTIADELETEGIVLHFMSRPKYVGMMPCVCKEHLLDLVCPYLHVISQRHWKALRRFKAG